jgi:diguanylate cyclase (GGDEF)-like protein
MWHSTTKSKGAATVLAALASAAVANLIPAPVLLPLLVLGVAVLAMTTFRSAEDARKTGLIEAEVASIVGTLERISHGVFEPQEIGRHGTSPRTPEAERIACALRDMTQQVQAQIGGLQDAAQNDPLTGMANRAHFQRLVERQLEQRRDDTLCCLMFIDIDGFKDVNDTLGHNLGDRLLQGIAERLRLTARLDAELQSAGLEARMARLGGDEFVIFLSGLASAITARKIANRVLRVIAEPFELGTHVCGVSASIGLAYAPQDAASYCDLLRAADVAMYHAKRAGGNGIELYTSQIDADLDRQVSLERDLREALGRGEFELHYQPQYDCRTLKINSAEALIRWRHPVRGLVSPAEFIPLAEKTNLICDIGEWVLREAAGMIARLADAGLPLRISINVSPAQLEQMEFVSLVKAALARCGAAPRLLEVEITESCALRDCELAADRLGRLADFGISVAIDDFGTGYSNLASLIRLPVSRLKIDRSLLADLTTRREVRTLAQTIISMANGLGFHSVAEGIEDAEQLALLTSMGCDVVQGFFLSRPLDGKALEHLLAETLHHDALYPKLAIVAR